MDARLKEERELRLKPWPQAAAKRADSVVEAFARLWPQCFVVYERRRRPLKIGIHRDILEVVAPAIVAGRISEDDVRLGLRRYTKANGYLYACRAGTPRISLAGQPAGPVVTEEQAARARRLLAKRRERHLQQPAVA